MKNLTTLTLFAVLLLLSACKVTDTDDGLVKVDLQVQQTYEHREYDSFRDEWTMKLHFEGVKDNDRSVHIRFVINFKEWQGDGSKDLYHFCYPNRRSSEDLMYKQIDDNNIEVQFECPNPAGDDFWAMVVTYHEMEASNITAYQNQMN